MWAEPVYSGTGVCKAGHDFSGTWSCGNVVLDPIMIFGCGMGIAGAAWGTVIAQCCTCVYVICFLRSRIIPGTPVPKQAAKEDCT